MSGNTWHLVELVFRANDETSVKVYRDEPMIFSISILNYGSAQVRFGGLKGWVSFIRLQTLSDGEWKVVDWPLWILENLPASEVAELDSSTPCYLEFGIDPDDANRPEEVYQVRAVLQLGEDVKVESNTITVSFLKNRMPKAERETEEKLLACGRYFFKRKLHGDARKYAQMVLKSDPSSIEALNLLGDIEEREGNFEQAISAFEKAAEEFRTQKPRITEPPEVFLYKIEKLKILTEKKE